jgi:hypothetical protein
LANESKKSNLSDADEFVFIGLYWFGEVSGFVTSLALFYFEN